MKSAKFSEVALGLMIFSSFVLAGDQLSQKDLKVLEKHCENGNFVVCTDLGTIYSSKRYVQKTDIEKAIKFYKIACDRYNYAKACGELGDIYMNFVDKYNALEYYKKSCSLGGGCAAYNYFRNEP